MKNIVNAVDTTDDTPATFIPRQRPRRSLSEKESTRRIREAGLKQRTLTLAVARAMKSQAGA